MNLLWQKFRQIDGPTLIVAVVLYGAWGLLLWFHASLPLWVVAVLGAYLVAWHFSLQHEAIHAFRGVPAWLRYAIVFPPLGLWFPYSLYRKSHSTHHRDVNLTFPTLDPESYYVLRADWDRMGPITRRVLIFNQTLLGRLAIGPLLRLWGLATKESARVRGGDLSHLPHWGVHVLALAVLFWFISGVCGFPWWQYCLLIAYPAMSLGLLRAFIEHRAAPEPAERIASVESNAVFGLLFLFNNLHIAHHEDPTLPWYDIPGYYRRNKMQLLDRNGHYIYPGYAHIARRYLLAPVFIPVHPTL
jgi:fatty acid desaturase